MEVGSGQYIFGVSNPDVVRLMTAINYVMPLSEFLGVDEESFAAQSESARLAFVAQSWALIHYCYLGDVRGVKWRSTIFNLLAESSRDSQDYSKLIRTYLGIEPEALERELHAYTQLDSFNGYFSSVPEGWPSKDISFRRISESEMIPHLEEVGVRLTRSPETVARLKGLIARGDASDREIYLAGIDRWLGGDRDAAVEIWTGLSEQFDKSALVIRAPAQQFLDSWLADPGLNLELSAEESAGFRTQLKKALEKDPSDQLTLMYLAWLEALSISPDVANVNLIQRSVGGLVHPELTLLAIAKIRMGLGDFETARTLVYEYHDREHWDWENLVDLMEEATDLWSHVQRE